MREEVVEGMFRERLAEVEIVNNNVGVGVQASHILAYRLATSRLVYSIYQIQHQLHRQDHPTITKPSIELNSLCDIIFNSLIIY